ncbi:MAG: FKBP-type peptidyl-prolyl cis-trans isomerase [Lachnospiraceae bacterium]|nr:FKBP-type peptidyl-prolyl cis-trans isomerase [Lachnospiraceae bacterium]
MRIAVTYNNGEVFQHFGHTEEFKVYEAEDGKVVSSQVIGSDGNGHEALAVLLADKGIDVLICGGIGGGAEAALSAQGIELCAGASGSADEAVEAYLRGELENTGANCDHHGEGHHDEGHACGNHACESHVSEDHACGEQEGCEGCESCEGCEGCFGGCPSGPSFTGKNVGKVCRTHYRGTFNDGTQFDSSYDRGEPLEFTCGAGMMIPGFDAAVANMEVGEIIQVHLMPSEAYGEADPEAVFTAEIAKLPGSESLEAGDKVYLRNIYGQPVPAKVIAKDETTITFDANHEMAGKELNFTIELVSVSEG